MERDIAADLIALAETGFRANLIEIDPPWDCRSAFGWKGGEGAGARLHIAPRYRKMTMEELFALKEPLEGVLDPKGCVMAMWVIDAFLEQCFPLIAHWGFRYTGSKFRWRKSKNGAGTGRWLRHDGEDCLLLARGKVPVPQIKAMRAYGAKLSSSEFDAPRPVKNGRSHSAKPERLKEILETHYDWRYIRQSEGPLPKEAGPEHWRREPWLTNRLEVFGRGERPGWVVLGDGE